MQPLADLQIPNSVDIPLTTLTPLYTGGIGQQGEQLHPSGLLGSIRHFSCLVAKALDEGEFEQRVWGNAGQNQADTHAKRVAIHWDGNGLSINTKVPPSIKIDPKRPGWYFNNALSGDCRLQLSQRGISASDWQILLLALRIQIRHATFGAKDQFGFGVLTSERLPKVVPLTPKNVERAKSTDTLWHTAFFTVKFVKAASRHEPIALPQGIKLGLATRYALRNALRNPDNAANKALRHQMFGSLNEFGSATNISAAYQHPDSNAIETRIVVQLKPNQSEQRTQVMKAFNQTLENIDCDGWRSASTPVYEWGGGISAKETAKFKSISEWINHLAGV